MAVNNVFVRGGPLTIVRKENHRLVTPKTKATIIESGGGVAKAERKSSGTRTEAAECPRSTKVSDVKPGIPMAMKNPGTTDLP